ncbi:MAG: hypothetical protein MJZ27_07115 [Bacteroidales bacterium]|nr:hypothetical protein [Bacteroidales bacterium]
MKKVFLFLAAALAMTACEPEQEDIKNDGHISLSELQAKTDISLDGNVLTCTTSAPVNAKWTVAGKPYIGNYLWKKLKLGDYMVYMDALCADGTLLKDSVKVTCTQITNALEKKYLWEGEFTVGGWDSAPLRFSDSEGQNFPTLSDEFYASKQTLILDVKEASDGCTARVMNGWWSTTYEDNIPLTSGMKWEIAITDQIAAECAKGGEGRDLNLLITNGSATFTSVYYEE